MNDHTTPAVEHTTINQEAWEAAARGHNEDLAEIRRELAFLSSLDTSVFPNLQFPFANILQAMEALEEPATGDIPEQPAKARESESKAAGTVKADTANDTSASSSTTSAVQKDMDDLDDMWMVDLKTLSQNDMKVLQQLTHLSASVFPQVNNLSPSLLEQMPQTHYKSLGVSKGLAGMLEKAYKAQRPLRVDLSETASVILRLGRDGRVSAEFMAADLASDLYFRQNLQELRSRLESKQLPLGDLLVRDWKQQPDEDEQKR